MSEEKNPGDKEKFLEALEKKKNKGATGKGGAGSSGSRVGQGQQGGSAPKMFRRKAGG
jgi:hypothetical protein